MNAVTAMLVSLAALAISPGKPHVVRINATDFAYSLPDTISAGLTTIEMTNGGKQMHHAVFFRLEQGKHLPDLLAAMAKQEMPMWAVPVGGPNGPAPGGLASVTVNLKPGQYALVCVIPGPDGMPHVTKGMAKEITVAGKDDPKAALPKADNRITLKDYDFVLDHPLKVGKQVVQVNVAAAQPHELVLVRLAPGKTVQDFAAWGEKPTGTPPAALVGGIAPMVGEREAQFTVDLTPGEYGLICFIPDGKDGKPHFLHGMAKQFKVG